jgi:hypothetical protein
MSATNVMNPAEPSGSATTFYQPRRIRTLLEDEDVRAGRYHTNFLEAWMTMWRAQRSAEAA